MMHCPPVGDLLNFIFSTVGTGTPRSITSIGIVALAEKVTGGVGSNPTHQEVKTGESIELRKVPAILRTVAEPWVVNETRGVDLIGRARFDIGVKISSSRLPDRITVKPSRTHRAIRTIQHKNATY